jgi:hypothetical protein
MSTRWFFSSAVVGAAAAVSGSELRPTVTFVREMDGQRTRETLPGPPLTPVGPGHVLGFDRSLVLREEPSPGSLTAAENVLASVELAHADLPWVLPAGQAATPSGSTPQPWLVLVVLAEDEAAPPRNANPLPVLTAPVALLPPLAERWAWAHVEARLPDGITDPAAARRLATIGVRTQSADVVARLVCPRQLDDEQGWIAALVPATAAGRAAGLNAALVGPGNADAWPAGAADPIDLPVYHWWRFRTGKAGTFEELAHRLRFRPAAQAGLGRRLIDVGRPWPTEPETPATVALDGALRVPGSAADEVWSDANAQDQFRALIRERLDAPDRRREETGEPAEGSGAAPVTPPLYGRHHSGRQRVPVDEGSWLSTLNLEIRRRVAAALGARYVQLEQEFLMARAWEQVGEIREANRMLAVTEMATAAAEQARHKHLDPLRVDDLVRVMAPAGDRVRVSGGGAGLVDAQTTLANVLARSTVPNGAASTSFQRLTRRNGALARRSARLTAGDPEPAANERSTVIEHGLAGMGVIGEGSPESGLSGELLAAVGAYAVQLRRMVDRIPTETLAQRSADDPRPLRPIMAHPTFTAPMAEELLTRWPEWALPGIGALEADSVTLLETNPQFVAALLVGLNHEFNAELLWREFPTDQRGTSFARFWPTEGADIDEIARWSADAALGSHLRTGDAGSLALLVRGELLRRFPGTALLAVRGEGGELPAAFGGLPATALALDESTVLYLITGLDAARARAEDWFFVFREPMRGTQFGFDSGQQPPEMETWADLTWKGVSLDAGRFVRLGPAPPAPNRLPANDPPIWGRDAADMARIAFQQPFQLAFRAATLLGG